MKGSSTRSRFGEVVFGTGESSLEAGESKDEAKDARTRKKAEGTTENRYLMVTVAFDPDLLPEPEPKPEANRSSSPTTSSRRPPTIPSGSPRKRPPRRRPTARRPTATSGSPTAEKKVKELTDRFADWYYVTPGDSFRSIALDRAALVKASRKKSPRPRRWVASLADCPEDFRGVAPRLRRASLSR